MLTPLPDSLGITYLCDVCRCPGAQVHESDSDAIVSLPTGYVVAQECRVLLCAACAERINSIDGEVTT